MGRAEVEPFAGFHDGAVFRRAFGLQLHDKVRQLQTELPTDVRQRAPGLPEMLVQPDVGRLGVWDAQQERQVLGRAADNVLQVLLQRAG